MSANCSVPTVSAAALICDTAPLWIIVKSAPDHQRFATLSTERGPATFPVWYGRVDYFLRNER
jgi:hypothetical protein